MCAGTPASQFLRHGARLVRMSGDSGVGLGVLMLEWRSLGGEEVVLLGSAADSCKEVGSGKLPTSFYSGCCGLFVPDDLTAFMTHHAATPLVMPAVLVVRRAPAGGGVRLRWGLPTLPVPGRLYGTWCLSYIRSTNHVGSATPAA
ncbi:hypothetical protein GW17_00023176 [Ensete ventricosum]|nr:hypothetical protein GW17_00023176 [Ensete ventricosum]